MLELTRFLCLGLVLINMVLGQGNRIGSPAPLPSWEEITKLEPCANKVKAYIVYLPYSWESCPTLSMRLTALRNSVSQIAGDSACIIYYVPGAPPEYRSRDAVSFYIWHDEPKENEAFHYEFLKLKPSEVIEITPKGTIRSVSVNKVFELFSQCNLQIKKQVVLDVPEHYKSYLLGPLAIAGNDSVLFVFSILRHAVFKFDLLSGKFKGLENFEEDFHCSLHRKFSSEGCKQEVPCDSLQIVRLVGYPLCRTKFFQSESNALVWLSYCILCDSFLGWKKGHMSLKTNYHWLIGELHIKNLQVSIYPWYKMDSLPFPSGANCFSPSGHTLECWEKIKADSLLSYWQGFIIRRNNNNILTMELPRNAVKIIGSKQTKGSLNIIYLTDNNEIMVRKFNYDTLFEGSSQIEIHLRSAKDYFITKASASTIFVWQEYDSYGTLYVVDTPSQLVSKYRVEFEKEVDTIFSCETKVPMSSNAVVGKYHNDELIIYDKAKNSVIIVK